jgi:hypothetical protein
MPDNNEPGQQPIQTGKRLSSRPPPITDNVKVLCKQKGAEIDDRERSTRPSRRA